MDYRKIGNTDVSLLGYGCMRFPTTAEGAIDEPRAEALLKRAYEAGITYFDTAWPYHKGQSEPFVGKAMKQFKRDTFLFATKLPIWSLKTLDEVKETFAKQLEHLQTDYIDFYLIHSLREETWNTCLELGVVEYLKEQKKLGKIRNLGFSFHAPYEVFEKIIDYTDWDFCQIQYNYMDTEYQAGAKGIEYAQSKNIPIVVMEPVKGGTLAKLPDYAANPLAAAAPGKTPASWALRFAASHENVRVVLSGMSSEDQLEDNLETFKQYKPFTKEEESALATAVAALKARPNNGCTGCKYCLPCPSDIQIPRIFAVWNEFRRYDNEASAKEDYAQIPSLSRAHNCVRCGRCEEACPQGIHIRDDLREIAGLAWAKQD